MSKPTSIDTLLEDVVLGRACGEREWNLLAQAPFDEYRSDRRIALEWFMSSHSNQPSPSAHSTVGDTTLVSLSEISSAIRSIAKGLFGKR
jgi:hypothetical protein